jgi:hypothetical protein
MKIRGCCLLLLYACAVTSAWAQGSTSDTGTILRQDLKWSSKIPVDKTWEQFTPEERAELRSMYSSLKPEDEPPYPLEGMKPIFSALKKAQHILKARGELNMVVTVGADGKAARVEDLGGVHDAQMTELTQQVLLLTRYKPGTCNGTPCAMPFPFRLRLKTG